MGFPSYPPPWAAAGRVRRILKPKAIREKMDAVEIEIRAGTMSGCNQNTVQDINMISVIGRNIVNR